MSIHTIGKLFSGDSRILRVNVKVNKNNDGELGLNKFKKQSNCADGESGECYA